MRFNYLLLTKWFQSTKSAWKHDVCVVHSAAALCHGSLPRPTRRKSLADGMRWQAQYSTLIEPKVVPKVTSHKKEQTFRVWIRICSSLSNEWRLKRHGALNSLACYAWNHWNGKFKTRKYKNIIIASTNITQIVAAHCNAQHMNASCVSLPRYHQTLLVGAHQDAPKLICHAPKNVSMWFVLILRTSK